MMNCPRCGRPIAPHENNCASCGLIFINSTDNNMVQNNGINIPNNDIVQNNVNNTPIDNGNFSQNNNMQLNNTFGQNVGSNEQNNFNEIQNNNLNNQQINMQPEGTINMQSVSNEPVNLEGYFIGKNYEKIKKSKFSWQTLVFGFLYTLYRRMLLISLIWIAIDVASVIIMGKYSVIIIVALNVIMSFLINYIYLALVGVKVDNIKRKYWGRTIDELIYRSSQKGGTSTLPVFFFGFGCVAAVIAAFLLYLAFYPQYYLEELYYRVPSAFKSSGGGEGSYASYEWADKLNFCGVFVSRIENYDNMDSYIENYINLNTANYGNYNMDTIEKETVSISGRDWKFVNIPTNTGNSYWYFTEDSGILYNYQFNIYNGFGQQCEEYYNKVKNSISIRNGK